MRQALRWRVEMARNATRKFHDFRRLGAMQAIRLDAMGRAQVADGKNGRAMADGGMRDHPAR
jgi:hypothetical protein